MYKLNITVEHIEKQETTSRLVDNDLISFDGEYVEYDTGVLQLSNGNQLQILNDETVIFEGGIKGY